MSVPDSRPALPIHLPFDSISPSFSKNSPCVFQVLGYYLTSLAGILGGRLLCAYDMNNHSKDLQTRYLRETAIVLAREGFQTDRTHTDGLHVQLDGSPLCEVTESGGIAYRNEDINEPERIDAKDKVYEIVKTISS